MRNLGLFLLSFAFLCQAQQDPGPHAGSPSAGHPLLTLTPNERTAFATGKTTFQEVDSVSGTLASGSGLGPRFNADSCASCHAFPDIGGSSPALNPQIAVASKAGALNAIPAFLSATGPVRIARFVKDSQGKPDGGVHDLFVISGRTDAPGCNIAQPDFAAAAAAGNLALRIPTPLFGAGLIEAIEDGAILLNKVADLTQKVGLGIAGHENRNANDGSLTRFGWKAQNKSLLIFAGEAYNVEQGVTNDVFPQERDSTPGCRFNATPEDHLNVNNSTLDGASGDLAKFVMFMRFLAPPSRTMTINPDPGEATFRNIGCALCHTPSFVTATNTTAALSNKQLNLFSDLLVHKMGQALQDGISQGDAQGDEFRTAPLWGLSQRLFLLHDGRATDLKEAIAAHSSPGSEANGVIANYNSLTAAQKQDLLRFLRTL